MFEARLTQGVLLRKLLDSMKDLVQVMVQANREPDSCDGSLQRFKRDDDWPFLRQPLHVFFSAFADQEYPVFIRLRCFCRCCHVSCLFMVEGTNIMKRDATSRVSNTCTHHAQLEALP